MKKLFSILIIVFILLGCSTKPKIISPVEVVETIMSELKKEANNSAFLEDEGIYISKFNELLASFDYEVLKETIDDNKAIVEVDIKTYDFKQAYNNTFDSFLDKLRNKEIEVDENTLQDTIDEFLLDELNNLETQGKNYSKTVSLNLDLSENEWVIDENEYGKLGEAITSEINNLDMSSFNEELAEILQDY